MLTHINQVYLIALSKAILLLISTFISNYLSKVSIIFINNYIFQNILNLAS